MLNFKKKEEKKIPTYLPKLKLMGRSTANKYIFKDGLNHNTSVTSGKCFQCLKHNARESESEFMSFMRLKRLQKSKDSLKVCFEKCKYYGEYIDFHSILGISS